MLEGSEQLLTWNESRAQCRKVSRVHFRLVGLIQSKSSAMTGHWEWGNCLRFEIGTYQESETCAPKSIAANFWSDIPSHPSRSLRISAALLATARGELAAPLFRSDRLRQNGFSPGL
jgi:hypothetical protein